jgi:septal ring factor EnvC (AmiA/AmiB activator)
MVDLTNISTALSSLVAAKDIAQSMIGLRDTAAFQEKRLELQSKIMDAQASIFAVNEERAALIKRVSDLEKEIADLETWESEKQRYEMHTVSRFGNFAYVLKESMASGEPTHLICANCYQKRKKSLLQGVVETWQGHRVLICHECGNKIAIGPKYVTQDAS